MISFENKKILVTGASSGIGREICIHLSELGAQVVLVARDEKNLQETISLMKKNRHEYFSYDLENIEGIRLLVEKCVKFDDIKIDGFIHSAGMPAIYPLKVMDLEKFEKVMKINTYSYIEIIKHLSKKIYSNNGASIVFLTSILTNIPKKAQSLYIGSKTLSSSISKVLSLELQKRQIRINSVVIGDVLTPMVEDTQKFRDLGSTNSSDQSVCSMLPLAPRDISNMVLFLLSDNAKYIIGENYFMDGGYF